MFCTELSPDLTLPCFVTRICPGMHFADASVFIWCAMILSVYDISKASENGKLVEPIDSYTTGAVRYVLYSVMIRCSVPDCVANS